MDDFEGMKNQIHSKIKDKIDENPASEEDEDALNASGMNANMADEMDNESPFHKRLKKRRTAADKIAFSDDDGANAYEGSPVKKQMGGKKGGLIRPL